MTSRVLVALRVAASPERAFRIFTGEIGNWWRPHVLFQARPGRAGTLAFEPGAEGRLIETYGDGTVFEIGRITAWEPPARLAFTWRPSAAVPDPETAVEVRFEAVGEETRVTVEHRGWDAIPPESVARHTMPDAVLLRRLAEWWQGLLGSYRGIVVTAR